MSQFRSLLYLPNSLCSLELEALKLAGWRCKSKAGKMRDVKEIFCFNYLSGVLFGTTLWFGSIN